MKIAILHFHLDTSGVTQVIRQHVAALTALDHAVILLSGKPPASPVDVPVEVIQGLGYDQSSRAVIPADRVAAQIMTALHRHWPRLPDLLHVHNPLLAKNRQLLDILKQLQRNGLALLCQVHDFAEDGRPDTYFPGPYPSNCHYAVINLRDYHILKTAGLKPQGLHYLPNSVSSWTIPEDPETVSPRPVLYPVRAIRRKNIGEAILLNCCRHPHLPLYITLPPTSAPDLPAYNLWRRLVNQQGLNVFYEAGLKSDFNLLTSQCNHVLTTSISEGFGFAFLEAWTGNKILSGRLLPDICQDFTNRGIQLDHLYRHLLIPLSWIDTAKFRRIWSNTMTDAALRYGIELPEAFIGTGWHAITKKNYIDFGLLDEIHQYHIICKILQSKHDRDQLRDDNPSLRPHETPGISHSVIHENRRAILSHYSTQQCGENLMRVYDRVITHQMRHQLDKKTIAMNFFLPDAFSLLKWRPFHGQ